MFPLSLVCAKRFETNSPKTKQKMRRRKIMKPMKTKEIQDKQPTKKKKFARTTTAINYHTLKLYQSITRRTNIHTQKEQQIKTRFLTLKLFLAISLPSTK